MGRRIELPASTVARISATITPAVAKDSKRAAKGRGETYSAFVERSLRNELLRLQVA